MVTSFIFMVLEKLFEMKIIKLPENGSDLIVYKCKVLGQLPLYLLIWIALS